MKIFLLFFLFLFLSASLMGGTINPPQKMKVIILDGRNGAKVSGGTFSTKELVGKVHCLFYADPDEKDLNEEASQALDKEKFPLDKYLTYGIINMQATWMPNFLIGEALKAKQRKYPDAHFIKDYEKVFVKEWNLLDHSNAIMVFNQLGERVFYVEGKLTKSQTDEMIALIWSLLGKKS